MEVKVNVGGIRVRMDRSDRNILFKSHGDMVLVRYDSRRDLKIESKLVHPVPNGFFFLTDYLKIEQNGVTYEYDTKNLKKKIIKGERWTIVAGENVEEWQLKKVIEILHTTNRIKSYLSIYIDSDHEGLAVEYCLNGFNIINIIWLRSSPKVPMSLILHTHHELAHQLDTQNLEPIIKNAYMFISLHNNSKKIFNMLREGCFFRETDFTMGHPWNGPNELFASLYTLIRVADDLIKNNKRAYPGYAFSDLIIPTLVTFSARLSPIRDLIRAIGKEYDIEFARQIDHYVEIYLANPGEFP
ncbi:MAG: hypothetical protein QXE47_01815 [Candidatus Anstonellales archaeon]